MFKTAAWRSAETLKIITMRKAVLRSLRLTIHTGLK